MKYFLDTEFIEAGPNNPLVLLSIGIVAEDGREFYAVNDQANLINMSDWVRDNVMPHLGNFTMSFAAIRRGVKNFINDTPEFWGYYADYDWVIFCQIFGSMIDLPTGWPMYCRDLKQLCDSVGNPKLPAQVSTEHNALHDAKWNKIAYEFLAERAIEESLGQPPEEPGFDEATETRWQGAIYEACKKAVGPNNDHLIDGGGCDSGDALDFTLAEIRQTFNILAEESRGQRWIPVEEKTPPVGSRVWIATKSGRVLVAWRTGWDGINEWTMEGLATLDDGDSVTQWQQVPTPPLK